MKLTRKNLTILIATFVLPMAAVGQDEDVTNAAASDDEVSENIVVASNKSSSQLRRDLWRSEKEFYTIYNELNDDSDYDVRCVKEAPTGSVIKSQVCRPRFLQKAIKEGKVNHATNLDSTSPISVKIATYRNNLNTLLAANAELQTAGAALNLAHAQVDADKERRARN